MTALALMKSLGNEGSRGVGKADSRVGELGTGAVLQRKRSTRGRQRAKEEDRQHSRGEWMFWEKR
jgi:hypothetical protein